MIRSHRVGKGLGGPLAVYIGLMAITLVWIAMIVAAPWLLAEGRIIPAVIIYQGFSAVCHQLSDRSFDFHGHPFGVCSRCTGIYAGFAFGLLLYPMIRNLKEMTFPPRRILAVVTVPMVIDFEFGYLGLWANTFVSRTVTGALFGIVVAFYILPGFVAAFSGYRAGRRSHNQTHNAVF